MQLMEDGEGGALGREVGMLEEATLGREEGVPGCVCGVGGCGAEERVVVECAGCGLYCWIGRSVNQSIDLIIGSLVERRVGRGDDGFRGEGKSAVRTWDCE